MGRRHVFVREFVPVLDKVFVSGLRTLSRSIIFYHGLNDLYISGLATLVLAVFR